LRDGVRSPVEDEGVKRLGLIVNPVAGMGGRVGLKGSDGRDIIRRAIELGASPSSPDRAMEALNAISVLKDRVELVTYPGEMGEDEARACGFEPTVIGSIVPGETTPEDTRNAAREMLEMGVDLVLFAGGDGTARDLCEAVDGEVPVLGIPAGVKIHSGVFATSPRNAGELAMRYLQGGASLREAEVMDIDEEEFRLDRLSARLYGYMKVPHDEGLLQSIKVGSGTQEEHSLRAIAADVVEKMRDDTAYILGPGTTIKPIAGMLDLGKTLLGVDVVQAGKLLAVDANEERLLELVRGGKARIVVTVIGG
jgi:predicted polyphosphate/ATP-dependent NAD kinase